MKYTELGATGLRVSVAGLGCGGNSRLGLGSGATEAQAVSLVRTAIDEGVNFLDTAEAYGTEGVVGAAINAAGRNAVIVATKARIRRGNRLLSATEVVESLEGSLTALRTDTIDLFSVHAVTPDIYPYARDEILPALLQQVTAGKIRHIGITESAPRDPAQATLHHAVSDEAGWEVMMLAYSMINQGAGKTLLPQMREKGIGSLLMFVVRNIFSQPALLGQTLSELASAGEVPAEAAGSDTPLDFLVHEGGAVSLTDAAYRFARHQSGGDVVLFGTGNEAHLKENIRSILRPPLPENDVARVNGYFGALSGIGLDMPDRIGKPAG